MLLVVVNRTENIFKCTLKHVWDIPENVSENLFKYILKCIWMYLKIYMKILYSWNCKFRILHLKTCIVYYTLD